MKQVLFMPLLVLVLLLASCEKTVTFDDTRKNDNEAQFAKIAANSEYTKINSKSGEGFIMYKVLKSGESEENDITPYFNDKIKALYTGWYKRFWTRDDTFTDDNGNIFQNKVIFDTTTRGEDDGVPVTFEVNKVVDGFSTALQHMHVGDKWEVWMPWQLGYGQYDNQGSGIVAYTTLVFEIELVEIIDR